MQHHHETTTTAIHHHNTSTTGDTTTMETMALAMALAIHRHHHHIKAGNMAEAMEAKVIIFHHYLPQYINQNAIKELC